MKMNNATHCKPGEPGEKVCIESRRCTERKTCHSCRYYRHIERTEWFDGECHAIPPNGTRPYWPAVFSTDEACIFWHSNRPSIRERLKLAMLKLTLYFFLLR